MEKIRNFYLYLTVFFTGGAVLILEILGSRILAPFYGSTIFVWSSLISVALGFLSLGYFLGGKMADKFPNQTVFYSIIAVAAGLMASTYQFKRLIIVFSDNYDLMYGPLVASNLFFALPFTIFGMASPYAIRLLTSDAKTSGSASGRLFAVSTLGSLAGSLTVSFMLIPNFPATIIINYTSIILILISVGGYLLNIKSIKIPRISIILILITIGLCVLGNKYKKKDWPEIKNQLYKTEVVYEKNNFYGESKVIGIPRAVDGRICFLIDSSVQSCVDPRNTDDVTPYEKMIAVFNTLPEDSEILVTGLGGGQLFKEFEDDKFSWELVDINPVSAEAVKIAKIKLPTKHKIIIEDARSFIRKTDKKYDLVFVDLFNNVAPVAHMLSVEALKDLEEIVKEDGILIMSHTGRTDGEDTLANSAINGLRKNFENVYVSSDHPEEFFSYVLFMASNDKPKIEQINEYIRERNKKSNLHLADFSEVNKELQGINITDEYNPSDYLWTQNIIDFEKIDTFRNKYKRLTLEDFN